ncbi:MAG: hypothetical protein Q9227_005726 [Pyrenula ochraceoflavens]
MGELQNIRSKVTSNSFKGETDFQTNIANLINGAHDGHLSYTMDAITAFTFIRAEMGPVVSVSMDGKALPQIYSFDELNATFLSGDRSRLPSPIKTIDDKDANTYLMDIAKTQRLQDPDAAYNNVLFSLAQSELGGFGAFFGQTGVSLAPQTKVSFANGTTKTFNNIARVAKNFTGVDSGEKFYASFCAAAASSAAANPSGTTPAPMTTSTSSSAAGPIRTNYPPTKYISPQGSLAGYFMNDTTMQDTAVLSINGFEEQEAQTTLTDFLQACRVANKKKLVIDVQANGGGNLFWGYDYFKQLFPSIEPFGAFNLRAFDQMDFVGQTVSNDTISSRKTGNETLFDNVGGDSPFDVTVMTSLAGANFGTWDKFFTNSKEINDDKFTNPARNNISDVMLTGDGGGIVVTGFGNRSQVAPQPFLPENMVILTDGFCASTCHLFTHFLKFQGKVKSVVAGGRPQAGPMQAVGGVKGAQVFDFTLINQFVQNVFDQELTPASPADLARFNATDLGTVNALGNYLTLRTADPNTPGFASVNLKNSLGDEDPNMTPLQFVYEAADCRVWWTMEMLFDVTAVWKRAAQVMWGGGAQQFCVQGSMGQPSSLSGNSSIQGGNTRPSNVTNFPHMEGVFVGGAAKVEEVARMWCALVVVWVGLVGLIGLW